MKNLKNFCQDYEHRDFYQGFKFPEKFSISQESCISACFKILLTLGIRRTEFEFQQQIVMHSKEKPLIYVRKKMQNESDVSSD